MTEIGYPPPPQIAFHPAPVGCRGCGTVLQASYAAEFGFRCPTCRVVVCWCCGCTDEAGCVSTVSSLDGSRTSETTCSWIGLGLCSFCGGRAAYELYMEATGRPATDPYYLGLAPSAFCVRGIGAGLDERDRLEDAFRA